MAEAGSVANLAAVAKDGAPPAEKADEKDTRRAFNYALVKFCDMSDEVRTEAVDMVVTAVEKHIGNYEVRNFLFKRITSMSDNVKTGAVDMVGSPRLRCS